MTIRKSNEKFQVKIKRIVVTGMLGVLITTGVIAKPMTSYAFGVYHKSLNVDTSKNTGINEILKIKSDIFKNPERKINGISFHGYQETKRLENLEKKALINTTMKSLEKATYYSPFGEDTKKSMDYTAEHKKIIEEEVVKSLQELNFGDAIGELHILLPSQGLQGINGYYHYSNYYKDGQIIVITPTIFRLPNWTADEREEELRQQVRKTLMHELGHYFEDRYEELGEENRFQEEYSELYPELNMNLELTPEQKHDMTLEGVAEMWTASKTENVAEDFALSYIKQIDRHGTYRKNTSQSYNPEVKGLFNKYLKKLTELNKN